MKERRLIAGIHRKGPARASRLSVWLVVWLPCTLALDLLQFLFFDCSGLPLLSILFGLPTFGAAVALPIVLFETWTTPSGPAWVKAVKSVVAVVLLLAIACLAGVATAFTHICM
jgi:hypothetical protein